MYKKITHHIVEEHFDHPSIVPGLNPLHHTTGTHHHSEMGMHNTGTHHHSEMGSHNTGTHHSV
jgi:hypothetical protein